MTIDVTIPIETKSLIRPLNCTFFPTSIPGQHPQLKNLISTRDPNVIYYASDRDVFELHIKSRRQKLVANLPWAPQCLDAAYGWICVGGPGEGRCAFIFVGEEDYDSERSRETSPIHPVEVDALLPIDLDPGSRLLAHSSVHRSQSDRTSGCRKPEIQIREVGGSIVNSVTVHRLLSDQKGLEDEVVVVLTDNDQTVKIFSLSQSRLLAHINFPTPMNHASISPDGNLLIAVGDMSQVFFRQRIRLPNCLLVNGEPTFPRYEWKEISEPKLISAQHLDPCFSTAFSPSGHICAAASQTGVINIFDTSLIRGDIEGENAVIEVLKSSPCLGRDICGAVRSMSFAPPPWDLLAWAEDQGRVYVIDLRNSFRYRQTIELETDSPTLIVANIVESTGDRIMTLEERQLEIEERFIYQHRAALDANDQVAAISHATDYIELAAARRRIDREAREAGLPVFGEEFNLLTDGERQAIDSIRLNRLQENEQSRMHTDGFGLRSGPPSFVPHTPPQGNRGSHSIRDYMRQRDLERTRPGDRFHQPRRRSSVVISNGSATNNSSSSHPSSLAPIGTATPTLSASPSRLNSSTLPSAPATMSGDPWQTIIEAVAPSTPNLDATTRLRRERDALFDRGIHNQAPSIERSRIRPTNMTSMRSLHRLNRQRAAAAEVYSEEDPDIVRHAQDTRRRGDNGVGIMGIGWSRDGRNLYVATEEGILEYAVNIDERKTFPGIDLR